MTTPRATPSHPTIRCQRGLSRYCGVGGVYRADGAGAEGPPPAAGPSWWRRGGWVPFGVTLPLRTFLLTAQMLRHAVVVARDSPPTLTHRTVRQLGVDETSFLKAIREHPIIYATGLVDLQPRPQRSVRRRLALRRSSDQSTTASRCGEISFQPFVPMLAPVSASRAEVQPSQPPVGNESSDGEAGPAWFGSSQHDRGKLRQTVVFHSPLD